MVKNKRVKGIVAAGFFIYVLIMLTATVSAEVSADKNADSRLKRDRFLVLDSRIIESTENVELTVGVVQKDKNNPLFKEDKPWEPRFDNPYCKVIYDEEENIYKCWYNGFIESKLESDTPREKRAWVKWSTSTRAGGVCYAKSKDGIHWEKPELGIIDFQGSKKNNIVVRAEHGFGIMKDPHGTDPQKRYKAIRAHSAWEGSWVWFSPDGFHWGKKRNVGPIDSGDSYNCVFWDPTLSKYVLFTRHWGGSKEYSPHGYRQVSRSESSDFVNWTKGKVVLAAPNPLQQQIHDMIVFRHAGIYIGLIGLWDMVADREYVELAWSPDSIQWHWIKPGTPLIPNGPVMGDYDWGCIFAAPPVFKKDEILLYYGSNDNRFYGWRNGFLCLAHLRPDGFAGYEDVPGAAYTGNYITGLVTTKPVLAVAGSLRISADVVMSGFVKVTLFDEKNKALAESKLISKTVTDAELQWKNGFSFEKVKGKKIKLRFELRDSKLFSFSFHE